jgi:hypothetical protein
MTPKARLIAYTKLLQQAKKSYFKLGDKFEEDGERADDIFWVIQDFIYALKTAIEENKDPGKLEIRKL